MADIGNWDYSTYVSGRPTWSDYVSNTTSPGSIILPAMPEDGTLTNIRAYAHVVGSTSVLYAALFSYGTDGTDGDLLAEQSSSLSPGAQSHGYIIDIPMTAYALADGVQYVISIGCTGEETQIDRGAGAPYSGQSNWYAFMPTWPDPANFVNGSSYPTWMWAVYTPGGGGGGSRTPRRGRTPGNMPMGAALQLRPHGVERARSRIVLPQNLFKNGGPETWLHTMK